MNTYFKMAGRTNKHLGPVLWGLLQQSALKTPRKFSRCGIFELCFIETRRVAHRRGGGESFNPK